MTAVGVVLYDDGVVTAAVGIQDQIDSKMARGRLARAGQHQLKLKMLPPMTRKRSDEAASRAPVPERARRQKAKHASGPWRSRL